MKIVLCGSRSFMNEMKKIKEEVEKADHEVILPPSTPLCPRIDENEELFFRLKPKYMREHLENIKKGDIILVCNFDKKGVKNYIGAGTFVEIVFAWYLNKKVYLLNPIPEDDRIYEELIAINPVIVDKKNLVGSFL